jgi:hypothetical protein
MNERIADVKSWSEASRLLLAPLLRIQQDGLGALDHFVRCQYAVAGDFLEWFLAQSKVTLVAKSPAGLLSQQTELGIKLREQLQSRVQELTKISSKEQTTSSPAVAVADSAAPASNVPAILVNTPVPAAPTVALTLVATRSPAAFIKSSTEQRVAPTAVQRPVSRNGESTSKDRSSAPSRMTRDSGKPKSRNKT